jgi:hypothetical protein
MNDVSVQDLSAELRLKYAHQVAIMPPEKVEALSNAKLQDLVFLSQKLINWLLEGGAQDRMYEERLAVKDRELARKREEINELEKTVGRLSRLEFKIRQKEKMIGALKNTSASTLASGSFVESWQTDSSGAKSLEFGEQYGSSSEGRSSAQLFVQDFEDLRVIDDGVQAFLLQSVFQVTDGRHVEEEAIQLVFDRVDQDKDGRISPQELNAELRFDHIRVTQQQLQQLFRTLDTDGNGQIAFQEFLNYVRKARMPTIVKVGLDFQLHEQVQTINRRTGESTAGQIQGIHGDGTYTVHFVTGERDGSVLHEHLRKVATSPGVRARDMHPLQYDRPEMNSEEYEEDEEEYDEEDEEAERQQQFEKVSTAVGTADGVGTACGMLEVGMHVQVRAKQTGEFLPAKIVNINAEGTVDVQFWDGARDSRVPLSSISDPGNVTHGGDMAVRTAARSGAGEMHETSMHQQYRARDSRVHHQQYHQQYQHQQYAPQHQQRQQSSGLGGVNSISRPVDAQQAETALPEHTTHHRSPVLQHQQAASVYNQYWDVHAQIQTAAAIVQRVWRGHQARRKFLMTLRRIVHSGKEQSVVMRVRIFGQGCTEGWGQGGGGSRQTQNHPANFEDLLVAALGATAGSVRIVDVRRMQRQEGVRLECDVAHDTAADLLCNRIGAAQLGVDVVAQLSGSLAFASATRVEFEFADPNGNALGWWSRP